MPNYCYNTIKAKDKENFQRIKQVLVNEENKIDFNKLIPMPADLDIISPAYYQDVHNQEIREFQSNILEPICNMHYTSYVTQDSFFKAVLGEMTKEQIQNGLEAYGFQDVNNTYDEKERPCAEGLENKIKGWFNLQRYKTDSWHPWRNRNWGTKWNAFDAHIEEDELKISFTTAWEPPYNIINTLVAKADFVFETYEEQELGSFFVVAKNGNMKVTELPEHLTYFLAYDAKTYDEFCEQQKERGILKKHWPEQLQERECFDNARKEYLSITQNPF